MGRKTAGGVGLFVFSLSLIGDTEIEKKFKD